MEPQETIYCFDNKERKCPESPEKKSCLEIIAVILLTAFTFTIGLLIGAALALVILISLPAIIVLAIVLVLLLLLTIILMLCNRKKDKKDCCCCKG